LSRNQDSDFLTDFPLSARYRLAFLEKRRRLLQQWLTTILLHPDIGGTSIVKQWVVEQ
jgi:hypothetical protein